VIIEVRAQLGRGRGLLEVLVEPFLTCATVCVVAALRDSRWGRYPRLSSGEAEILPEDELGRDGDCARGRAHRRTRQRFVPEDRLASLSY
jgi:hypothetical protein